MSVSATQHPLGRRSIVVHIGRARADVQPKRVEESLIAFFRRFRREHVRQGDKDGPCFFPVEFNGGRTAANVVACYGLVLDIDNKDSSQIVTANVIVSKLAGYIFLAHTTYSHSVERPKFRIFIPYGVPVTENIDAMQAAACSHFAQLLGKGAIDSASKKIAQLWYLPACPPGKEALYQLFGSANGELFDPLALPAPPASPMPAGLDAPTPPHQDVGAVLGTNTDNEWPAADAAQIVERCAIVHFYTTTQAAQSEPLWYSLLGLAKHCTDGEEVAKRWSSGYPAYDEPATLKKLGQWQTPPPTCATLRQESGNASHCAGCPLEHIHGASPYRLGLQRTAAPPTSLAVALPVNMDGKPIIKVRGGDHPKIVDACDRVIGAVPKIFQRGGGLVHIITAREAYLGGGTRGGTSLTLRAIAPERLSYDLGTHIQWMKGDVRMKTDKPIDPPSDIVRKVMLLGEWQHVKPLRAIASTPTLRPDGTVLEQHGYDAATQLFMNIVDPFNPVPQDPTRDHALQAAARLFKPFQEFPFKGRIDIAVHIAAILTRLVRPILSTAPAIFYHAPMPGAGKTKLADSIALIADGAPAAKTAFPPQGEEEIQKLLLACLVSGDRQITFDNLKQGARVDSGSLCGVLTSATWGGRILGQTLKATLPSTTLVVFTGNNVLPQGDLVRRSLICRIEPNTAEPERRTFTIPDLDRYLLENRCDLVVAGLTILRAYVVAGCPPPEEAKPLGSFEEWNRLVRGAVIWLGLPDPVRSQEHAKDEDEERSCHATVLDELAALFPGPFTVRDVMLKTSPPSPLPELLMEGSGGVLNTGKIGAYFKRVRGRISSNGKKIDRYGSASVKPARWLVQ